jgi:hypothetical protein
MKMSNSSLVKVKAWASSSNYTKGRSGNKIKKITIHHMAGVLTAAQCGNVFKASGRGASAHYGVGSDGKIGQYVDEANTAWSDGNWTSNCTSVSIEVANSSRGGQWPVSSKSIQLTIKLVADIAKRNKLGKLVAGKNLTWHSMYAATACPGPYLKSKIKYIAQEANKLNEAKPATTVSKPAAKKLYRVRKTWADEKSQKGAFAILDNAKDLAKKHKGYKVYDSSGKVVYDPWKTTTKKKSNTEIAKEIVNGTCSDSRWKTWGTGDTRYSRLKKAGYDADAIQKIVNQLMEK